MKIPTIIVQVFEILENKRINYCIYNGYENLPSIVDTDLDIAIESRTLPALDNILSIIVKESNAFLLHKIWHDNKKIAYVLSPSQLSQPQRLQIDFFSEFSSRDFKGNQDRFCFMNETELLEKRNQYKFFYISPPHKEFIFKFLRRVLKEDLIPEKFEQLLVLYNIEQDKCISELARFFPEYSDIIINTLNNRDLKTLSSNIPIFKKSLKKFRRSRFDLYNLYKIIKRALFRMKYPVGMSIAFLGPDGCGKSTLARRVTQALSGCFHGERLFYWRPEFLKQPGVALGLREDINSGLNPNPHGHPPENPIKSFIRFNYYLLDFTIGYLCKVWPPKVKKHVCIFDRYYYDILIDKFRYNFSLPKWLLKLPLSIVPKPDLTIILDVPLDELVKRKQELSELELNWQRNEFLKLACKIPNTYIVNNALPFEQVIAEITSIILLNKSYQTYLTLNLKSDSDTDYFKKIKQIFGLKDDSYDGNLIGYPQFDNPRVFVSLRNSKIFKTSLSLYTPSRPLPKFLHNNIPKNLLYLYLNQKTESKFLIDNSPLIEKIKKIFPSMESISISTGAPGPHRKPLVQVLGKNGKTLGFVKVGINDETNALLEKETAVLNYVKTLSLNNIIISDIIDSGTIDNDIHYLALSAINIPFKKSYNITDAHIKFILEIFEKTGRKEVFRNTQLFSELEQRINFLEDKIPYFWILRYKRILISYKDKKIPVCLTHGDFTPWNVFLTKDNRLLVFDWEYSRENIFVSDLFHLLLNPKIFSGRKPINEIILYLYLNKNVKLLLKSTGFQSLFDDLLLLYLLEISTFYFYRNYKNNYIEIDLRHEITWSHLIDLLLKNIYIKNIS